MEKKITLIGLALLITLVACKDSSVVSKDVADASYQCPMQCEGSKTYVKAGSCPICKMDLKVVEVEKSEVNQSNEISEMSIYNLPSAWTNQNNEEVQLLDFKGDVLVMVMIYTSCKAACPRLVADMRHIEERLSESTKDKTRLILVSIDPVTDTPERLNEFAKENHMDKEPWTFLVSTEENTREFAAVLAVNYKKISPIDFSHSNIISVFDKEGEMVFQQEGLGVNSDATVEHIQKSANQIE